MRCKWASRGGPKIARPVACVMLLLGDEGVLVGGAASAEEEEAVEGRHGGEAGRRTRAFLGRDLLHTPGFACLVVRRDAEEDTTRERTATPTTGEPAHET